MEQGREEVEREELVEALTAHLERAGARVEREPRFEKQYGLDFTITRLEQVYAHVNLGVHVTSSLDDHDEIERFAQLSKRGIVVKSLYIELDLETFEGGSLLVAMGACLSYLFERRHQQSRALGVRIHEDCSYHFFPLDEALDRLDRADFEEELQVGEEMEGRIIAYFTEKGFGFIQNEEEQKFFFHIANIIDDDLRSKLPGYVPGEVIPVDFQYGGNDGKKYPKAVNVALPFEDD